MASFEAGAYDPQTYDLKAACPDAAACAYGIVVVGIVVDNELHRLDDASNEMVAAAVADTGPEANWFVTISGERGDDGHASIDRIDRGLPGNRRWCFRCTACGTLVCCGLKDCDDD